MSILLTKNLYPYGVRKHIRQEKARIRGEFLDVEDRKHHIEKLYLKFQKPEKKVETLEKPKELKKIKKGVKSKSKSKSARSVSRVETKINSERSLK